jgi:glycerol-3-phosphate dehydrogenase (NAD(P)+)
MWGSVIASLLHGNGNRVGVWDPAPRAVEQLLAHRHPRSMPDWRLPSEIEITGDLDVALRDCDLGVVVTDSQAVYDVAARIAALPVASLPRSGWVLCSKGLDMKTGKTLSAVLESQLGKHGEGRVGVLSGPCIAPEVARGIPTSVVAAAPGKELVGRIQRAFMTPRFRVYSQRDMLGVELCGALKNVMAIAAGMCDGLGFGANTKSALITRGLAEMTRLGEALGADPRTFAGLAGMGDLVVTSFSPLSRNRRCGEALGRGLSLDEARREIGMAIEGIATAEVAYRIGNEKGIELPITQAVHRILQEHIKPEEAVELLMRRDPKPEWY